MQWSRWVSSWTSHLLRQTSAPPQVEEPYDFLFQVVVVGDCDVGKTSLVRRFQSGRFLEKQNNTIGLDFTVRTLEVEGRRVKMQVWDTAGQERFRTLTQSYYRSAHGALVAYDITRRHTFESAHHWIQQVEQHGAAGAVLMLIGNKCDLGARRQVLFEEACSLAEGGGLLAALETSAKDSQNVEVALVLMAKELLARHLHAAAAEEEETPKDRLVSSVTLSNVATETTTSIQHCYC